MRIVTRFDGGSAEYIVEIQVAGRDTKEERYTDFDGFNRRVQKLQTELLESRWVQNGTPAIMRDGWRGPTSGA